MEIIERNVTDDEFVKSIKEQINKLPEFWLKESAKVTNSLGTVYRFRISTGYVWTKGCSMTDLEISYVNGYFKCHVIDYDQVNIKSKSIIGCLYGVIKYHQEFLADELSDYTMKIEEGFGKYTHGSYIEESYDII